MSTLVTRAGKGSPLTHNEVDANFNNLNTDKIQSGNTVAALTITSATVTDLAVTGITSFDGAQGTSGQVLTSAGTGATPTWTTPTTGTVTSVTGTAPVVSSGGATPAISMAAATTSVNGYLTSTDWTTFNGKISSQWTTTGSNIYYNTGSVGIGTSSPSGKLHVSGGSNPQIVFDDASSRTYGIGVTSSAMSFYDVTGAAERMRIDSSGGLFIGTTTNANNGAMIVQQASNGTGITVNGVNNTSGAVFMYFTEAGANCGYIQRIGTTGAVVYATSSDYRLKENVKPMTGALATVAKLKPVTYDWKTGGSAQGFIAHELQEVIPDAVTGVKDQLNEDGSINAQGIDQSRIVAILTAAIKELNAKVDALEAKLGK
jgi:hypothetical protein